ncbi:MAG: amidoligase family protein [Synechococcus sp.]
MAVSTDFSWKVGIEIELMAPRGSSRATLAQAIAEKFNGEVRRFFHPQSEPSKIAGTPVLENLTLGFEVRDRQGLPVARCVDDLTLQADCQRQHPPRPGWYRIVSDDIRLLRLVQRVANPEASLEQVLNPVASLFGVQPEGGPGGMIRVRDRVGPPIAIAAPLPGERERPCELIVPPMVGTEGDRIGQLLEIARTCGFTIPVEGAIHLHFDATRLCCPRVLRNLVRWFNRYGLDLKQHFGTNPHCQRLGHWPDSLLSLVEQPEWLDLDWPTARDRLRATGLTKYCDFNLSNIALALPDKHTFEVRILPVWMEAEPILQAIGLLSFILQTSIVEEKADLKVPFAKLLEQYRQLESANADKQVFTA